MSALRFAAARAVHLKVYPRPASLAESRELLSVLQQFGEVSMFKSLRFDYVQPAPNTCLAIYRDATAAAKLLKASPLRFTLEHVQPDHADDAARPPVQSQSPPPDQTQPAPEHDLELADAEFQLSDGPSRPGADEMIRPSTLLFQALDSFSPAQEGNPSGQERLPPSSDAGDANASPAADSENAWVDAPEDDGSSKQPDAQPASASRAPEPKPPREFHVIADVSEMNHRDHIERSLWYGPYLPRKRTASYLDLTQRGVPSGIADVYTNNPEKPFRSVNRLREEVSKAPTLKQIWEMGLVQK